MKRGESDLRGWAIVGIFLLLGLLCVIAAGNLAIRLAPSWSLPADMRSRLHPDGLYPTLPVEYVLQPLDPAILTPPVWVGLYLTPGQTFPTRISNPTATPTEVVEPTQVPPTLAATATPTFEYILATRTPIPAATSTPTRRPATSVPTATSNPVIPTDTSVSYATVTLTSNPATPTQTSSQTPTNTPISSQADLQITKSDGIAYYAAGSTLTYTIVVSNPSLTNVTGALVSDPLPPQIADWSWTCSPNNGASECDPSGNNSAAFNDVVNLPGGSSIAYTVVAHIRGDASGSLSNTASITPPAGIVDPVPGNNSATDTDEIASTLPYGDIGITPDKKAYVLPSGSSVTLAFNTPLVVNGHPSWDLVLYEMPYDPGNASGIAMDLVQLQIGDGVNWYTVFFWGDGLADTNSNLNISTLGGSEDDNRDFANVPESNILYPFDSGTPANPATGIVIELDNFVPPGTYPYFRIISPTGGDVDGGCEIDAITILP